MRSADAMVDELRSPTGPRRAVIRTVPGAGIRSALEAFIGETSTKGLVLILVPSQALAEQWASRLDRQGVDVEVLRSTSDALLLRSVDQAARPRGVIVATFARARHGQARTALGNYRFDLLLYDGVSGGPPESLDQSGVLNAAKEIALVTGTSPFEWDGAETFFEVTEQDFDAATRNVVLTTISYEGGTAPGERTLDEARQFLARFAGADLGDTDSATRASLHEMLLKVGTGAIASPQPTTEEKADAWRLADKIESADEVDARLTALDYVLRERSDIGRWIVSVLRRADAYYVRDYLSAQQIDAAVITGDAPQSDRQAVLESGTSVIIATTAVLTSLGQWPRGYGAVWWNPPRTRLDYETRMSLLATAGDARVFQLLRR